MLSLLISRNIVPAPVPMPSLHTVQGDGGGLSRIHVERRYHVHTIGSIVGGCCRIKAMRGGATVDYKTRHDRVQPALLSSGKTTPGGRAYRRQFPGGEGVDRARRDARGICRRVRQYREEINAGELSQTCVMCSSGRTETSSGQAVHCP